MKLETIINEVHEALEKLKPEKLNTDSIRPHEIIEIGKTIQKAESKLNKEYNKRLQQKAVIDNELDNILKFAEKMNYRLNEETAETKETEKGGE